MKIIDKMSSVLADVLNKLTNPMAVIALLLAAVSYTIYHPLYTNYKETQIALQKATNNFNHTMLWDILKQGEKLHGPDLGDMKQTDIYKLLEICDDKSYQEYIESDFVSVRLRQESNKNCAALTNFGATFKAY